MRGVRQHVNPLGLHYQRARAEPIVWPTGLPADAPVEVELGCADAKFSFELAAARPECFVVGLEIREALVERNRARARKLGLDNLAFAYVNLNVDLARVFPLASVDRFHLLFPDPWFKRRHQKRRVMDLGLLETLAGQLKPGGRLHVATDVFELGLDALDTIEAAAAAELGFRNEAGSWSFTRANPSGIRSLREETTLARGQRVWRVCARLRAGSASRVALSRAPP